MIISTNHASGLRSMSQTLKDALLRRNPERSINGTSTLHDMHSILLFHQSVFAFPARQGITLRIISIGAGSRWWKARLAIGDTTWKKKLLPAYSFPLFHSDG
jgi:hypothetical protein